MLRILGGQRSKRKEVAWQIALYYSDGIFMACGGTLISPSKIVTVAHCFGPDGADAFIRSKRGSFKVKTRDYIFINNSREYQYRYRIG